MVRTRKSQVYTASTQHNYGFSKSMTQIMKQHWILWLVTFLVNLMKKQNPHLFCSEVKICFNAVLIWTPKIMHSPY